MSASAPSPLRAILEACLYHDSRDRAAVERFYVDGLGLRLVARWPDGIAFRIGTGVLLLFDRQLLAERDSAIAAHGAAGPGHACLLAHDPAGYDGWKQRLVHGGVEITHEQEWEHGRRSFYFHDPAGNLLEIADGDLWPP
jgi:catechol 2,3-dioxygenase-like lactoylglutathione lyase family enzyme